MSQSVRLGLFIILTLAVLAGGVFLIGNNEALWQSSYLVKAEFQNVGGLNEGADVRVGGIRKGSVQHIQLPRDPKGKVTVVISLGEETKNIVRLDSVAEIKSEGLLGDKFVEISFGSRDAGKPSGGEVLKSVPPFEISDVLVKTDSILDSAKVAVDHVQSAAGSIDEITAKINQGKGTAGALVNDRTMYKEASASVSAMHDDLEALKGNFLLRGFFNKRGYVDSSELKKHELAALPAARPVKTFTFEPKEIFDKAESAKLKNKKALDEVGAYLEKAKFGLAVVVSSASLKGDTDKMLTLTQAQTTVIRNYLVQNFRLDDTRIKTRGLGKSEDLGPAAAVEIRVYAAGK
ncbi:MAG TPA: MlaD family protein [Bryobacteraceae bacterium]|jgi:phospholipid/cholesterol/gamma-HCH transport system substrate-binding protein